MKIRRAFMYICILLLFSCAKNDKEQTHFLYLKALDSYTANDLTEAEKIVRKIIAHDKKFYPAFLLQGKIHFFNGDYEKAETVFAALVKRRPEYTEAKIWHIRTQILCGNLEKAEEALKKELTFNTSDWRIYYLYSLLASAKKEYETQIAMLNQAEEYSAETVKIYLDQARFWYALSEEKTALTCLQKASALAQPGGMHFSAIQHILNQINGQEN